MEEIAREEVKEKVEKFLVKEKTEQDRKEEVLTETIKDAFKNPEAK